MPVRIAVGDAQNGPWLEVAADGRVHLSTRFLSFTGHVVRYDGGFGIALDGTGCLDAPRILAVAQDSDEVVLSEMIPSDKAEIRHQRRYRFKR